MISRRKTLQDESKYEKLETRLRNSVYALIHELLQVQLSTPLTFSFLLLIESIQFFWYTVHSEFTFLWTVNVADWMRKAVQYFQVDAVLRTDSQSIFLILFYVFFSIQFVMLLLAMITCIVLAKSKRKTSTVLTYSLKILSVWGLVINHLFALPIFQLCVTAIICNDSDNLHGDIQCYQGIYFFHLVMGILGLIMFFITSVMSSLLYVELNPYYKIPFAAPQSKINLGKLLIKLALALYMTLDWKAKLVKGFIVVYGVIWLGVLVLRYRQTPYYNKNIFRFVIGLESICLWSCIVSIVHAFIDSNGADDIGLFFLFFGMPFAAYAAIHIIDRRSITYRQLIVKNLNKDTDVEMYLNCIFYLIENRDKPDQKMALEGLLKYHIKHCNKKESDCVCYTLSRDYTKEEEAPEKLWYTWVKSILVDVLEKFPKSARLHILYAYVQREKLNNKYKALFEMMIAKDNKPSVEQEFSIYRYKSLIEEEIIEEDSRNSEAKGIDVNVIVHFQNSFVAFQAALENAVELHLEFWRELLENSPGIYKLQSLGSMITHSVEEIGDRYKKLNEINPNHIKMLQSYGNFLKNIVNDDVEGQRVLEKADYVIKSSVVNKQFIENDRLKYGENSNTCIITVSGNQNKMGTIKNVNNEITRILGFSKADLIGQNVNRIIPKYLSEIHDSLMRNYFETSESKIMGQERFVFPLTKKGYVVPCTLMIKVLPDLTNGVRLVGFLNDVENENGFSKNTEFETEEKVHYVVYSGDTGAIHGFTKSCRTDFGLSSSIIYGTAASNDFTMDVIFPELLTFNIEDLKNPAGVTTFIDTSNIQQDYLLAHSESDKSEYEEAEEEEIEEKKYRKANVRAVIVDESVYQNLNMKILKFTEIIDDREKDMRKTNSVMNGEAEKDKTQVEKTEQSAMENHDAPPDENVSVSEKESNPSVDNAVDELKQLKDFKALISEKTEPKSIKTLSRALIALIVLLGVIAIVELVFKIKQVNDFDDGLTAMGQAYQRHNIMANINFQSRLLELLASGQVTTGVDQWTYKNSLITLIDNLSTVQFNIMQATEVLEADGTTTADSQSITLETQLDTSVTTSSRVYTDSVFQYITAASQMRNASLANIILCPTDPACQSFYFVRANGLNTLRAGSESEAEIFYNYYMKKTDTYNTTFLIIMLMGIILLVVSETILIPIVFSVHKTNNRVLSLFGYIPSNEIEELAAKCEEYMENYLEDHKERRDYSFGGTEEEDMEPSARHDNQDSSYLEVSQNHEIDQSQDQQTPNASMQLDVSERVKASPISLFGSDQKQQQDNLRVPTGGQKGGSKIMSASDKNNMTTSQQGLIPRGLGTSMKDKSVNINSVKDDEKRKDEADLEAADLAYIKSQKLLNSKDNRRSKVMIQFIGIAMFFFAYFLLDYLWLEKKFINDTKNNLYHFKLSTTRMSDIRYLNVFTLEELSNGTKYSDDGLPMIYTFAGQKTANYRTTYQTQIQSNTNSITSPSNLELAGTFDDYVSTFKSYTTGNLCNLYYGPLGQSTACSKIANALLQSGITQTVTTIVLNTADVTKNFYAAFPTSGTAAQQNATQITYINIADLISAQSATSWLMPPLEYLLSTFETKYTNYLNNFKKQEIIKFVVYIVFCAFVFVALWLPYRKNLSDKIFRTKGMLNMIPIELITKYKSLNELFTDANILQGVK